MTRKNLKDNHPDDRNGAIQTGSWLERQRKNYVPNIFWLQ
jgi:hypothetical protein